MTLTQCFLCFVIYSFLGWVYESLFYSVQFKKAVNTGFLRGCICPIYGLACVGNALILKNAVNNTVIFLVSMITISTIEYIVSYILEELFDKRWWDYSDWPCNLNGRISLLSSLGFGALSVFQMKVIHPIIILLIFRLPVPVQQGASVVLLMALAADVVSTIRNMGGADDDKLWFVSEELPVAHRANEKMDNTKNKLSEKYNSVKERIRGIRR